jgi:predicted Rossmann-fold nucleotide-binding protein
LKCLLSTWTSQKPIAVLNTNGFYDALIVLLETMVKKGFLKEVNYQMLLVSDDEDLLNQMKNYVAPTIGKWITTETT